MQIAIVDDETIILKQIKEYIQEIDKELDIDTFASAKTLLDTDVKYDIIFLDIQMDDLNGLEAAKKIRKMEEDCILQTKSFRKAEIIFVTALTHYMKEAFDVNAFQYLIKPLEKERVQAIFQKVRMEHQYRFQKEDSFLFVKSGTISQKIYCNNIYFLDCYNKKITIHTASKAIEFYGKMEAMEQQLDDSFYRCHRSIIVHFKYIVEYNASEIIMKDGSHLAIAKPQYPGFVKAFMRYAKNGGAVNV